MPIKICIFFFLLQFCTYGQDQDSLTADDILNRSIVFCGGEKRLAAIKTSNLNYLLIQADESMAIINEKRRVGKKYTQSILSMKHTPQTTFFDTKKLIAVIGDTIIKLNNVQSMEEMKLKTYNQIQYGYKELKCKLTRLPDKKFQNFDCYVVEAKAKNGYTIMNFFDKTNFRLLMVVYPNGNKSLMIKYSYQDSVMFNSEIVNTFAGSEARQTLILQHVELNIPISNMWFKCPYKDKLVIPPHIKRGEFVSTTGPKINFVRTESSQDYKNAQGKLEGKRLLKWTGPDTFLLLDDKAPSKDVPPEPEILVRIVSWNKKGYVCQWLTGKYMDTQDYKIKK